MNEKTDFGKILRELRYEMQLTQSQLAAVLNTSQDTISLWENGRSYPDFLTLKKLTDIFDVSADYLLGKSNI